MTPEPSQFPSVKPYYRRARTAAIFALVAIGLIILAAVLFDSGQTPIGEVIGTMLPVAFIAAVPLVILIVKLRRQPSRRILALAVAYPVAVLGVFLIGLKVEYESGSEGSMNVMYSLMFFWFSMAWTAFLFAYLPAILRLLVMSWRAYRSTYTGLGPIAGWTAGLGVLFTTCAVATRQVVDEGPSYRLDVVDNALAPMNECIWRFAGPGPDRPFPDSLEQIRDVSYRHFVRSGNPQPDDCRKQVERAGKYPFVVEYGSRKADSSAGRPHYFTLRFTERTRPGGRPRVTWIDETGLRHDAVRTADGKLDSIRLANATALQHMLIIQHHIDRYAESHGDYPRQMVPEAIYRDSAAAPGRMLLEGAACSSAQTLPPGDCVEHWDRAVVYRREPDSTGRMGYTLTMAPATFYDNELFQPIPSRTHFRDANGRWHSFGGLRPANAGDPPPAEDEVRRATQDVDRYLQSADRARRN